MAFGNFGMQLGMGPPEEYGPSAAQGNPSGYGGTKVFSNKSELIVGVIVVAVLFMLIAGVITLRASGEVVI
jgi:hypothetical protein